MITFLTNCLLNSLKGYKFAVSKRSDTRIWSPFRLLRQKAMNNNLYSPKTNWWRHGKQYRWR